MSYRPPVIIHETPRVRICRTCKRPFETVSRVAKDCIACRPPRAVVSDRVLDPPARPIVEEARTCEPANRALALSPRERQLAALAARPGSYADMAAALGLSPKTVKEYLHTLYRKLGFSGGSSRVALAMWARSHADELEGAIA